ncbi:MAG: hypothetical protein ACREAB_12350 [Blastocatellia bacterium]
MLVTAMASHRFGLRDFGLFLEASFRFLEASFRSSQKCDRASIAALSAHFFRRRGGQNTAFSALRAEHGDAIRSSSQQQIKGGMDDQSRSKHCRNSPRSTKVLI